MEKYYYQNEEKCKFVEQDSEISSPNCMECEFFSGVDFCESWVKCKIYSAFAEVELLKDKISELNKIIDDQKKEIIEYKEYEETVIRLFENKE